MSASYYLSAVFDNWVRVAFLCDNLHDHFPLSVKGVACETNMRVACETNMRVACETNMRVACETNIAPH